MLRLKNLEDLLFPVEEHPVFVSVRRQGVERHLPAWDKKAIVNAATDRVLGIVSRGYRLVTNQQALNYAFQCCREVFPETEPIEWQVGAVDAPRTASYCHVDLVHTSTTLDFAFVPAARRPDIFGPFIRVTNSYNALHVLAFEIGFFRKVCSNGLIVPDTIIRFAFTHLRRDIGDQIRFEVDHGRLASFKAAFVESLTGLRECAVARDQFEDLVRGILLIRPPKTMKPSSAEEADWQALREDLKDMSRRYAGDLGENAYAVFNVLTDFASNPPDRRCIHRNRRGFQRLAGAWLASFHSARSAPGFSILAHLEQFQNARMEAEERQKRRPSASPA